MSVRGSLVGVLPDSLRESVRRQRKYHEARSGFRSLLDGEIGNRYRAFDPGPVASSDVVAKTELMTMAELARKSDRRVFLTTGVSAMTNFLRAGIRAGLDIGHASAAFELGCGGGRLIRHLRCIDGMRLVGSDLLEENVAWCRANLPGIEFHKNDVAPPLSFASDGEFDFAFAFSVFTHVPMHLQLAWLKELDRILKPEGAAVVTVTGPEMAQVMMDDAEYAEFMERGNFTMGPDHPHVSASSALAGSPDVFMTPETVSELYGQVFDVVDQTRSRQSVITLRKRG